MNTQFKHIHIGGDHAGFEYKQRVCEWLKSEGIPFTDHGPDSAESTDYPPFAHAVANGVDDSRHIGGIVICGSGNGVCMTANKHAHVRAALCWEEELAKLARLHNNANVLCIPARFVSIDAALKMAALFLTTPFEGGRHQRRVDAI
jgi:ribose 5-phosphate isomerase B